MSDGGDMFNEEMMKKRLTLILFLGLGAGSILYSNFFVPAPVFAKGFCIGGQEKCVSSWKDFQKSVSGTGRLCLGSNNCIQGLSPVHGGWSAPGPCSSTCGWGTAKIFCNSPAPANGGSRCLDRTAAPADQDTEACKIRDCDAPSGPVLPPLCTGSILDGGNCTESIGEQCVTDEQFSALPPCAADPKNMTCLGSRLGYACRYETPLAACFLTTYLSDGFPKPKRSIRTLTCIQSPAGFLNAPVQNAGVFITSPSPLVLPTGVPSLPPGSPTCEFGPCTTEVVTGDTGGNGGTSLPVPPPTSPGRDITITTVDVDPGIVWENATGGWRISNPGSPTVEGGGTSDPKAESGPYIGDAPTPQPGNSALVGNSGTSLANVTPLVGIGVDPSRFLGSGDALANWGAIAPL